MKTISTPGDKSAPGKIAHDQAPGTRATPPNVASFESLPLTASCRSFTKIRQANKPGINSAERILDPSDAYISLISGTIARVYRSMTLVEARKKLK